MGPTLVDYAGGELKHRQFARSLAPAVADPRTRHREEALSEIGGEAVLLTEEWKLAVNQKGQAYLLFDVKRDPGETKNLAGHADYAEIERTLRLRLLERIMESQERKDRK